MHRVSAISIMGAGLWLTLGAVPSWAGPPNNDVSDAQDNTAGGTDALQNNTGGQNTAFGFNALQNNTGNENTAFGFNALQNNTGCFNTACGYEALENNTTGNFNTATGTEALAFNVADAGVVGPKCEESDSCVIAACGVGHERACSDGSVGVAGRVVLKRAYSNSCVVAARSVAIEHVVSNGGVAEACAAAFGDSIGSSSWYCTDSTAPSLPCG